jgi:peptidylprolyl isomerase
VRPAMHHHRIEGIWRTHQGALMLATAGLAALAVGCSSGGHHVTASKGASVTGAFGAEPTITIGSDQPPAKTQVTVVSRGTGRALQAGDLAVVDDYGRTWRSPTTFQNTFSATALPDTLPVGTGKLGLPGLDSALVGVPAGSRVLVVLPPAEGFGTASNLPTGIEKTDTGVIVFDVRDGFAANAGPTGTPAASAPGLPIVSGSLNAKPVISIPKATAPSTLASGTLIQGSGRVVAKGDELVVQYVGQIWASGKEFDASWNRSLPASFAIGLGQLIPAWDHALVGAKVGSRVLIVAPPSEGYGSAGQPTAGISGTDALVFVVDVLGAYSS